MKKYSGVIVAAILATGVKGAASEDLVAARNIRTGAIVMASDIVTPNSESGLRLAASAIGKEAARSLYQGQPFQPSDLRAPTLIERNAIVLMEFKKGAMTISAEGRALDKGGMGERIRVMNLQSRRIITAVIVNASTVRAAS